MSAAAQERARVRTPLLACSAAAWGWLLLQGSGGSASHGMTHSHAAHAAHAALDAGFAPGWAIMLVAMMLPLLGAPIRHVVDRSLAARRARSVALFLLGYGGLWMAVGLVLTGFSRVVHGSTHPAAAALVVFWVLVWQVCPFKQVCLNRLHGHPALAAFGAAADRDALQFGVVHAFWCAGSCWGLMLLPLLVQQGHLLVMLLCWFWMWGEQLERTSPPSWRWRMPVKAARMVAAQLQLRVRGRSRLVPAAGAPRHAR